MVNPSDESEEEAVEMDVAEETQTKKKKRKAVTDNTVGTSSSKPPKKTGRRKDEAWKHADELKDNQFRCKHCRKTYSGGADRIKRHLCIFGKKGGITPCPNYPPRTTQEATNDVSMRISSLEREPQSYHDPIVHLSPNRLGSQSDPHLIASSSPSTLCLQSDRNPILSLPTSPLHPHSNPSGPSTSTLHPHETSRTQLLHYYKLLVKDRLINNLPLDTIKKPYFRSFIGSVTGNENDHEFSSDALEKESIRILKTEVEQYVQIIKDSWSQTGFTLKIHLRKRRYSDFFEDSDIVGYTIYSPKGVIFLNSKKVNPEDEKEMEKGVTQILHDLDHENDPQHALFLYVGSMAISGFCKSISICAHKEILKLLYRTSEECSCFSTLLTEAKGIYEALSEREDNSLVFYKYQHPFSKLQAVMQHKKHLENIFPNQSETSKEKFWKDGEEVLNAVGPLIQILNLFDSFVPSIGYLYEAMEKAEKRIKHFGEAKPNKFKKLWELFSSLKPGLIMPIHIVAAYLNPSYVCIESSIKDKIDNEEVMEYMTEFLLTSEENIALENDLMKYGEKHFLLFTEEARSMSKTYHPVTWWKKFGESVPVLSRCAIRLLSQPSTCLSHLCHKPKFEVLKFEDLNLLRLNLIMMDEFKELEETDMIFKPIDLSIIDE